MSGLGTYKRYAALCVWYLRNVHVKEVTLLHWWQWCLTVTQDSAQEHSYCKAGSAKRTGLRKIKRALFRETYQGEDMVEALYHAEDLDLKDSIPMPATGSAGQTFTVEMMMQEQ